MSRLDRANAPHHVYRCFDRDGRLIYVGSTANLFGRLEQHRATSWWAPTVARVSAVSYPDGTSARAAERVAIRDEVPRWNKSGKWAGRHAWSIDDWHDWLVVLLRDRRITAQLQNSLRDYRSLFGQRLPTYLAEQVAEAEAHDAARSEHNAKVEIQRQRERAARDSEELRELNDELTRLLARQEALARALGIEWDDPDLMDAGAAIEAELMRRLPAPPG